ncbi:unnamed protein product [Protopolystoma xenopodis]|uniref:Uncharacterized protein n=1 Tax=Protopolystoma xenopodis TaxID=117903 RepID=A0A3S5CMK2_9PLAT|nr:unnamed protein product [Protopolystoma xenopodis]
MPAFMIASSLASKVLTTFSHLIVDSDCAQFESGNMCEEVLFNIATLGAGTYFFFVSVTSLPDLVSSLSRRPL